MYSLFDIVHSTLGSHLRQTIPRNMSLAKMLHSVYLSPTDAGEKRKAGTHTDDNSDEDTEEMSHKGEEKGEPTSPKKKKAKFTKDIPENIREKLTEMTLKANALGERLKSGNVEVAVKAIYTEYPPNQLDYIRIERESIVRARAIPTTVQIGTEEITLEKLGLVMAWNDLAEEVVEFPLILCHFLFIDDSPRQERWPLLLQRLAVSSVDYSHTKYRSEETIPFSVVFANAANVIRIGDVAEFKVVLQDVLSLQGNAPAIWQSDEELLEATGVVLKPFGNYETATFRKMGPYSDVFILP